MKIELKFTFSLKPRAFTEDLDIDLWIQGAKDSVEEFQNELTAFLDQQPLIQSVRVERTES